MLHRFAHRIHHAVEATLDTDAGFYGCLAAGWELGALRDGTLSGDALAAMMAIEGQVALLQSAFSSPVNNPG